MFGSPTLGFMHDAWGPLQLWQWFGLLLSLLGGVVIGSLIAQGSRVLVQRVVQRTESGLDDAVADAVQSPLHVLCFVLVSYLGMGLLKLPDDVLTSVATWVRAATIASLGWAMIRALNAVARSVADGSYTRETMDPLRLTRARSLRTQVIVANRVFSVVIFVVGTAMVALQFQVVRSVGMSLLASAGVAGVVLGFAAQKSLGALLAGIQISLSQPIRIGDAVVLEGEFGTIEDIGLTYVAVKLWDERRLIVPTPRFLEAPFQNWSRAAQGLLGTVMLRVDFDMPVATVREELERIVAAEPLWDQRVANVQVTDAGEKCLELRVLVSARSPAALWDLRTAVREKLVHWLQSQSGGYLPHARVVMSADGVNGHGHPPALPVEA